MFSDASDLFEDCCLTVICAEVYQIEGPAEQMRHEPLGFIVGIYCIYHRVSAVRRSRERAQPKCLVSGPPTLEKEGLRHRSQLLTIGIDVVDAVDAVGAVDAVDAVARCPK